MHILDVPMTTSTFVTRHALMATSIFIATITPTVTSTLEPLAHSWTFI